jgi:hypothetical protein
MKLKPRDQTRRIAVRSPGGFGDGLLLQTSHV